MTTNLIREFSESSQLAGGNADYVESLYDAWLADAASVSAEWASYFETFKGRQSGDVSHLGAISRIEAAQKQRHNGAASAPMSDEHARKQAGVLRLLTAYRSRGHLAADLDPLGLTEKMPAPDLGLAFHGLSDADLDTEFDTGNYAAGGQRLKLRDLLTRLKKTYASTIGAEFMHISNHEQRNWIYSRLEQRAGQSGLDKAGKQRVLDGLTAAEGLERYLHTKYVGQKRFSLEGGDSLIPMLDDVVREAGDNGIKELVIGMAHRGRLNVLVNILGKPAKTLFDEFEGKFEHPDDPAHSGDVKYHMGFSADVRTPKGGVHVALAFNPSHLEIVNPVVCGSVHARQTRRRDTSHTQSMAVLIHGDAAFAGQGVNMELLNMSQARGFKIGGSLHIVINNQVGFTTSNPQDARSTMYCTDLAKMINAPVLHVNGDDPEAVIVSHPPGLRFPQAVPPRRGDRPGVLSPPRPQRGRRTGRHPAGDVPDHPQAPDRARSVSAAAGEGKRAGRGRRTETVRCLPRPARNRRTDDRSRPGAGARWPCGLGAFPRRQAVDAHRHHRAQTETAGAGQQDSHLARRHHAAGARGQDLRRPPQDGGRRVACGLGLRRNLAYATLRRRRSRHAHGRSGLRSRYVLAPPRRVARPERRPHLPAADHRARAPTSS